MASYGCFKSLKYSYIARKMKFYITDFCSKWIWSHILKKSLIENFRHLFDQTDIFLISIYTYIRTVFNSLNAKVAVMWKPVNCKSVDWFLHDGNFSVYYIDDGVFFKNN